LWPSLRRRRARGALSRGGWRDRQLFRPVIPAVGGGVDHVVAAAIAGQDPARRDADEGRSESLGGILDRPGPPECGSAAAGNDALGDVGGRPVADKDGVRWIDHAEARGIAVGAWRDAGLVHRHRFIQDGTPAGAVRGRVGDIGTVAHGRTTSQKEYPEAMRPGALDECGRRQLGWRLVGPVQRLAHTMPIGVVLIAVYPIALCCTPVVSANLSELSLGCA